MNIAILSDIHSNKYALKAVLDEFKEYDINKIIVLGDIFGYYPWASETYSLLLPYISSSYFIKGNHDQLLLDPQPPEPIPSYWELAKHNAKTLAFRHPGALQWLKTLPFASDVTIGNRRLMLIHGTPQDPCNGRYYPDDTTPYDWLPGNGEILLLGHTHYPLIKYTSQQGILFNPGSVGQPRDGNPMASWGVFDPETTDFRIMRTHYDNVKAMEILEKMQWNPKAIASLNKTLINGRLT